MQNHTVFTKSYSKIAIAVFLPSSDIGHVFEHTNVRPTKHIDYTESDLHRPYVAVLWPLDYVILWN